MKHTIADIDTTAFLDAAFGAETPEEAEFRRVFGRQPDDADRRLGLRSVVQLARALENKGVSQ